MPDDAVLHNYDCSLARCATGRSCSNLRELLDAVRTVPEAVLEHHMMRCARQLREYLTMMLCLDHPETSLLVGSKREGILQH
jgi:hypothetical protein